MKEICKISKCDCGQPLTEKDIGIVERAPANYYPYEGDIVTFICPRCGYLMDIKEDEVRLKDELPYPPLPSPADVRECDEG